MDKETRGIIENGLDHIISGTDTRERTRWILTEISVHSQEDFALGYLMGSLARYARDASWMQKRTKKSDERMEREFGKERYREVIKRAEERMKDYKPTRVYWTRKDEDAVKNMLKNRLVAIRRKVMRDFHR